MARLGEINRHYLSGIDATDAPKFDALLKRDLSHRVERPLRYPLATKADSSAEFTHSVLFHKVAEGTVWQNPNRLLSKPHPFAGILRGREELNTVLVF
ncbi:hypothetical protein ACVWWG_005124 [Bradyrhizobium sp. LB7.2]